MLTQLFSKAICLKIESLTQSCNIDSVTNHIQQCTSISINIGAHDVQTKIHLQTQRHVQAFWKGGSYVKMVRFADFI